jgi:hypothetical protein
MPFVHFLHFLHLSNSPYNEGGRISCWIGMGRGVGDQSEAAQQCRNRKKCRKDVRPCPFCTFCTFCTSCTSCT